VAQKFPNLFIIGAMKAGTTSLHECLARHPDVFMSSFKEPQYFSPHEKRYHGTWGQGGELPEPGIAWYLRLFENAGAVRYAGESSTSYTKEPWVTGCAARIHAFNPEAKLIYLVRDPADRTMSHYWYQVAGSSESRPPLEAVKSDERYIAFSDYARQLRPYLELFDRSAIYVLTLEALIANPVSTLDHLFRWLGIQLRGHELAFYTLNAGAPVVGQFRRSLRVLRMVQVHWRWRALRRRHPWAQRLERRVLYRRVQRDPRDEEAARAFLGPIQIKHVEAFSSLVGRDFPEWKSVAELLPERTPPASLTAVR
jgi:hypothetical protein